MIRAKTNLSGGIVGLANVGKSTFFQAITKTTLGNPANYPFATIDPEVASVAVPSPRLEGLAALYAHANVVPTSLQVVDIAGLVRGAAKGDGLGNAFLSHIRAVDGLFQIVRAFEDPEITHVENSVDPVRDLQIIHDELVLKDMEFAMKSIEVLERGLKNQAASPATAAKKQQLTTMTKALSILDTGKRVATKRDWTAEDMQTLRMQNLLTTKPSVFVVNVSEEDYCFGDFNSLTPKGVSEWVDMYAPGETIVPLSVGFESRLSQMQEDQQLEELNELNVQSALPQTIAALRKELGLHSFFTAGPAEVREWTIRVGTHAPQAAGTIHQDFEKTFIVANVTKYEDFINYKGNEQDLKKAGLIQRKGKDYIIEDGDIIHFRAGAAKH